jgi:hypothetical protein
VLRTLRAHPDWLEEVRATILTEELLALPGRFRGVEDWSPAVTATTCSMRWRRTAA